MGFATLGTMSDTQTRILISIFSHCFINADLSFEIFRDILGKLDGGEDERVYDADFMNEKDFDPFIEWLLIAAAKYIAEDDESTLSKLRRNIQSITPYDAGILGNSKVDTLAAAAFLEVLYPVKYAIFLVEQGLSILMSSDMILFDQFFQGPESSVMQPVVLSVIVASANHLDKTVLCPGVGSFVKGKHKLPGWLIAAANRCPEATPGSVAEMILN